MKKTAKYIRMLQNDGIQTKYSEEATKYIFLSNSGLSCSVDQDELQNRLNIYGVLERVISFRHKSYTIAAYQEVEEAIAAQKSLNGQPLIKNGPNICVFFITDVPKVCLNEPMTIPGLQIVDDFIDESYEKNILSFLSENQERFTDMKNRSVLHFGFEFNYEENNAFVPTLPFPDVLQDLIASIRSYFKNGDPDQITINRYSKGQSIPIHFDTHSAFEETIVSLSLQSPINIEFRHAANSAQMSEFTLHPRSLLIMQDEARYCYKHGIRPRSSDVDQKSGLIFLRKERYSITFRKIRQKPCECPYLEYCDWDRNGQIAIPRDEENAKVIEKLYVQGVYEEIADHFDKTRHSKWRKVVEFLDSLPNNAFVVDAGCGNGKYLTNDKLFVLGFDACLNLLKTAKLKGEVFQGSILNIPLKSGVANAVISIAVIHHFATVDRRRSAIIEIARVLAPGGKACVTVWSFDQKVDGKDSMYNQMRSTRIQEQHSGDNSKTLVIHDGTEFTQKDMLVPWQKADKLTEKPVFRFYHLFDWGELDSIIESVSDLKICDSYYEEGNYIVIFEKLK
uniref:Alkylated DNA repair protein alkB homolog 8 n=1 Tax=Panagrolaimus sp. JU765 TaxID=591449 RepID=A0AC34QH53_9BILA